ncbi:hypothetical protein BaRGS_00033464 [Batillaria attramentaria]|uniref:Uncharacterized protein n=1 Tax=Batillaria attramentaria TaxID=370345 RepID=A0ABD0JK67_9CAEN
MATRRSDSHVHGLNDGLCERSTAAQFYPAGKVREGVSVACEAPGVLCIERVSLPFFAASWRKPRGVADTTTLPH